MHEVVSSSLRNRHFLTAADRLLPGAAGRTTLPAVKRTIPGLLKVVLCAIMFALQSLPAWSHCRPENRVWGFSEKSSDFASQESANPIAASGENPGCGYDFASGMHKYLYAQADPVDGSDPTGFWTEIGSNFRFGQDAEVPVVANFTSLRRYIPLQKLSVQGVLNYASNTGYNGLGRLIPDLVDGQMHEIYDVKSWNEVGAGMMKIELYRYAFTMADPDPVQAQLWHAGTTYNYTGPNPVLMTEKSAGKSVYAVYYPTEAGVVPYKLYRVDNDQDKNTIPIPAFDAVTQQNRQSQAAASSGLALAYSSCVAGTSLYLNYYSHTAATSIAGWTFAGLATMTAIATLNSMQGAP